MSDDLYTTYMSIEVEPQTTTSLRELRDIIRDIVSNEGKINAISSKVGNIQAGVSSGGGGASFTGSSMDILAQKYDQLRHGNLITELQFLNDSYTRDKVKTNLTSQLRQTISKTFEVETDKVDNLLGDYVDYLRSEALSLIKRGATESDKYKNVLGALQLMTSPINDKLYANDFWRIIQNTLPNEVFAQRDIFKHFEDRTKYYPGAGYVSTLEQLYAPPRPNTKMNLSQEERLMLNDYWNTPKFKFTPEQYGEISRLTAEYMTADTEDEGNEIIDKLVETVKGIVGKAELGVGSDKFILPMEAPSKFWEKLAQDESIGDTYRKIMRDYLRRSETDLKFIIEKRKNIGQYFRAIRSEYDEEDEAFKYLEELEDYMLDKFKDADEESPIAITVPLKKFRKGGVSPQQITSDELVNAYRAPYLTVSMGETSINRLNVLKNISEDLEMEFVHLEDKLDDLLMKIDDSDLDLESISEILSSEFKKLKNDVVGAVRNNNTRPGGL